jgi:hypothetical protein
VRKVKRAKKEWLDHKVQKVCKVFKEFKEFKVFKEFRDPLVRKVLEAKKAIQVHQGQQDVTEFHQVAVAVVHKDLQEVTDQMACRHMNLQIKMDSLEQFLNGLHRWLVQLVPQEMEVAAVRKGTRVQLALPVQRVTLALRVRKVFKAFKVFKVNQGSDVLTVYARESKATQVHKVKKAHQVKKEIKEFRAQPVRKELSQFKKALIQVMAAA